MANRTSTKTTKNVSARKSREQGAREHAAREPRFCDVVILWASETIYRVVPKSEAVAAVLEAASFNVNDEGVPLPDGGWLFGRGEGHDSLDDEIAHVANVLRDELGLRVRVVSECLEPLAPAAEIFAYVEGERADAAAE